ncbi:hypothetical protein JYK14_09345 [Siccirubricoccus sp. KC 17139]|uniref:Uncharacterized protein n=1 Tax=Siccirubricoccus soli TaxID=2899147 RepID=A0ABT1D379_9PROT|nr:hypothetical protein [Siccirubricoccus soli]MCO6416371.1 hypothetical protein [Siccirubricoccus soli]MCP2682505.1 hypothetical protein [Siccirubricoccus soli]
MARRPNYGQQRAEVNRGKQAKQEAKRREREAAVAERRTGREEMAAPEAPAPMPPPVRGPAAEKAKPMARQRDDGKWVLFDVTYADGSRRSNRKVPAELLGGLDGDDPARAEIEAQDQRIAEASGKPAGQILSLVRSRTA